MEYWIPAERWVKINCVTYYPMLNRGLSAEPAMESELISEGMRAKDQTQIFSAIHW